MYLQLSALLNAASKPAKTGGERTSAQADAASKLAKMSGLWTPGQAAQLVEEGNQLAQRLAQPVQFNLRLVREV